MNGDGDNLSYDDAVEEIARRYGVPRSVYSRMVGQESGGRDDAVSPKGASSRWQIMPATAKGLGIDASDPLQAAEGGLRLLRDNYKRFRKSAQNEKHAWMLAVAGYHGNPANVEKDLKRGGYGLPEISDGAITTRDHVLKIFDGIKGETLDRNPLGKQNQSSVTGGQTVAPQPVEFEPTGQGQIVGDVALRYPNQETLNELSFPQIQPENQPQKPEAVTNQPAPVLNTVAPVPETPQTLDAQKQSTIKPDSPRIATLYTKGENVPPILPEESETLFDVELPETGEKLRLNREKAAAALGLRTAAAVNAKIPISQNAQTVADVQENLARNVAETFGYPLETVREFITEKGINFDDNRPVTDSDVPQLKAKGEISFSTANLKALADRINKARVRDFVRQNGYAPLIGKAENVGTDTQTGAAVVARDENGNELSASRVTTPANLQKQLGINRAEFGGGVVNTLETPEQVINDRIDTSAEAADIEAIQNRTTTGTGQSDFFKRPKLQGYGEARVLDEETPVKTETKTRRQTNAPRAALPETPDNPFKDLDLKVDVDNKPTGLDIGEHMFRQASRLSGQTLFQRNLDDLEVNALTELQRQRRGGFLFDNKTDKPIDKPYNDVYTLSKEGLLIAKNYLEQIAPQLEKQRNDILAKRISGGLDLTEEDYKALEKFGINRAKVNQALSDDETFADARAQGEKNREIYRQNFEKYAQDNLLEVADLMARRDVGLATDEDVLKFKQQIEDSPEYKHQREIGLSIKDINDARRAGKDLNAGGFGSELWAGTLGATGRFGDFFAGVTRPLTSLGIDTPYQAFAQMGEAGRVINAEAMRDKGFAAQFANMLGGAPIDIPRLYALTRLPKSGAVLGFATDAALQSAGRGESISEISKEALKGAALGAIFSGAGKLSQYLEKGALSRLISPTEANAILSGARSIQNSAERNAFIISKILGEGTRLGTIGAGTAATEIISGASPEEALKQSALMVLFDLTMSHGKKPIDLAGKVFKIWKDGKSIDVTVDEKGDAIIPGKPVPSPFVDGEIIIDANNPKYAELDRQFKAAKNITPEKPVSDITTQQPEAVTETKLLKGQEGEEIQPAPKTETVRQAEQNPQTESLLARAVLSDGRDMVLHSTKDVKELRRGKDALTENQFQKPEVEKFVEDNYKPQNYENLQGRDNVFLVMPSTSGRNTIPRELAKQLQKDFGGEIVQDFALPLNLLEAKNKGGLGKLTNPASYELTKDLSAYAGKNVVIVDDVLNTGDTVQGLRRELGKQGINETQIAALGASGIYLTTPRTVERIAQKLSNLTKKDYNTVLADIRPALENQFGQFSHYAESSIKGWSANKVYEGLKRASEKISGNGERTGGIQPQGEIQPADTRAEYQPGRTAGASEMAAGADSPRRSLEDLQKEKNLVTELETTKQQNLNHAELFNQAQVKTENGITYLNPQAAEIVRQALGKATGNNNHSVFTGAYLRPSEVENVLGNVAFNMKGESTAAKSFVFELAKGIDSTHGDLVVIPTNKELPQGFKPSVQEELGHRADFRSRNFQDYEAGNLESSPIFQKAKENVRKVYDDVSETTLKYEVVAKTFRDDVADELGITTAEADRIQLEYLKSLQSKGVSDNDIVTAFESVSPRGKEFSKYVSEQRTATGSTEIERAGTRQDATALSDITGTRRAGRDNRSETFEGNADRFAKLRQTEIDTANRSGNAETSLAKKAETLLAKPTTAELEPEYIATEAEASFRKVFSYIYDGRRDVPIHEAAMNIVRTGFLAGVSVVKTNLHGNTLNIAVEQLSKPAMAIVDIANAKLNPKAEGLRYVPGLSVSDIVAGFFGKNGLIRGGLIGDKGFLTALAKGVDTGEAGRVDMNTNAQNPNFVRNTGIPLFDVIIEGTKRLVVGVDRPFKAFARTAEMRGLARIEAKNQVRQGLETDWRKAMRKLQRNPSELMKDIAERYAETVTFQNPNAATAAYDNFRRLLVDDKALAKFVPNEAQRRVAKYVGAGAYLATGAASPFVTTPSNIGFRTLEYFAPTGAAIAAWKFFRIGQTVERQSYVKDTASRRAAIVKRLARMRGQADKTFNAETDKYLDGFDRRYRQKMSEFDAETEAVKNSVALTDAAKVERYQKILQQRKDWLKTWQTKRDEYAEARENEFAKTDKKRREKDEKIREGWNSEDAYADIKFTAFENRAFAEAAGRAGFGATIGGLLLLGVIYGLIEAVGTTDYKDEPEKWKAKQKAGIPDNSVKIGGYRTRFDNYPFGNAMKLGINLFEQYERPGGGWNRAGAMTKRTTKDLLNLNPLTSQEFKKDDWASFAGSKANSMTPFLNLKILQEIGEVLDEKPRKYWEEGFGAQYLIKIPVAREALPESKNYIGGSQERGGAGRRFLRTIDPLQLVKEKSKQKYLPNTPLEKKKKAKKDEFDDLEKLDDLEDF